MAQTAGLVEAASTVGAVDSAVVVSCEQTHTRLSNRNPSTKTESCAPVGQVVVGKRGGIQMRNAALVVLHAQLAAPHVKRHAVLILASGAHRQQRMARNRKPRHDWHARAEAIVALRVHDAALVAGAHVGAQPHRVVVGHPCSLAVRVDAPAVGVLALAQVLGKAKASAGLRHANLVRVGSVPVDGARVAVEVLEALIHAVFKIVWSVERRRRDDRQL